MPRSAGGSARVGRVWPVNGPPARKRTRSSRTSTGSSSSTRWSGCRGLDEHIVAVHDNGFIPEGSPVEGWEESTGHSGLSPTSPTLVGEDRQVGASALPRPDGGRAGQNGSGGSGVSRIGWHDPRSGPRRTPREAHLPSLSPSGSSAVDSACGSWPRNPSTAYPQTSGPPCRTRWARPPAKRSGPPETTATCPLGFRCLVR